MTALEVLEVVPFDAALGAEIRGVDLSQPLAPREVTAIRQAWLRHLVLLFRGQRLGDQQLMAFSRQLGELQLPPTKQFKLKKHIEQEADVPTEVNVISNVRKNGKPIGHLGAGEAAWHTDSSFYDMPPTASILHALEIPSNGGGNTSFLNMYAALETLPEDLRRAIEGRRAKHDQTYSSAGARREDYPAYDDVRDIPGPYHPLIRTHPETGRKALYLGRRLNAYIEGLAVAESEALLDRLWDHTMQDRFVWEHSWRVGDVIMWDNRCVMHRRDAFDDRERRILHRTQLVGDRPY